jgi:signal transduction histidine kinase
MIYTILLSVLTNTAQLTDALQKGAVGESFNLNVIVTSIPCGTSDCFAVQDDTGSVILLSPKSMRPSQIGSRIAVRGSIKNFPCSRAAAVCHSLVEKGYTSLPEPETVTLSQIHSGICDARVIRTTGMLRDYFIDEIDSKYVTLILNQGHDTLYASFQKTQIQDMNILDSLIGSEISLTALCDPRPFGFRRNIGRLLRINDVRSLANNAKTSPDPFSTPLLTDADKVQAAELSALGRRRVRGHVIAVWQNDSFLLKTTDGSLSRVDLAKDTPPKFGETIEVVGFPETDLYRINFSRAIWQSTKMNSRLIDDPVSNITAAALLSTAHEKLIYNADFYGRTVRLRGTVLSLPNVGRDDGRFYLESDGFTIPVDVSANPSALNGIAVGCVIDVTGTCVMDIENWRPNLVFPHIKEVLIVTRTPQDIALIRPVPWWTPARLLIVIGSLLLVLFGVLGWNTALRRLAEKRGQALAHEELERLESDLKVCERTRLAVELHDSIAQNLTGVSMEIDTALRGEEQLPSTAKQHMSRALRTIDSCRVELRNCLWDLRSRALEENEMNKAIRLTLSQTIGKAALHLRFNVARSRFTDNAAHTILRIIRELTANAIRHGRATQIWIAGCIENGVLTFSVRDNGCGFDPDTAPGILQGHFGLQGIRERVASFEGDMKISSSPSGGTKVIIFINAPQDDDKKEL